MIVVVSLLGIALFLRAIWRGTSVSRAKRKITYTLLGGLNRPVRDVRAAWQGKTFRRRARRLGLRYVRRSWR